MPNLQSFIRWTKCRLSIEGVGTVRLCASNCTRWLLHILSTASCGVAQHTWEEAHLHRPPCVTRGAPHCPMRGAGEVSLTLTPTLTLTLTP
jgi:hypothetical protein